MATPRERLTEALKILQKLQEKGVVGIYTNDIPNARYRQLLVKNGFIREVTKGWYIATNPSEMAGESTSWYSSYWDFIARFLNHKYGEQWCVSPDQSMRMHAGNRMVPQQLVVRSPKGNNKPTPLPLDTSLFNLKSDLPPAELTIVQNGIRMYTLQASIIYSTAAVYARNAIDARTALSQIADASELLPILLEKGHTTYGGRLAGAFRNIERDAIADQIIETFKQADYDIREEDPFYNKLDVTLTIRDRSPYVNRIRLMWTQMREDVIKHFPAPPARPANLAAYLKDIDDIYVTDAYHSLSIERYVVTPELIARVSSGAWDSKDNADDRKHRDAMAARGYYQAFLEVKKTIESILSGANPGTQTDKDHGRWYRQLFDPSVVAGLLKVSDLSGYRNNQVYIGNSKHVPLNVEAMRDAMPVLFELIKSEPEASVRAVLGHFIFVYIHPYMDGNGRIGRFLMNAMLASGGFPWTVIPVERRDEYMQALEKASVEEDITPFASFIGRLVQQRLDGITEAKLPR